jgi:hypothetical protein
MVAVLGDRILVVDSLSATLGDFSRVLGVHIHALGGARAALSELCAALSELCAALGESCAALSELCAALGESCAALGESCAALGEPRHVPEGTFRRPGEVQMRRKAESLLRLAGQRQKPNRRAGRCLVLLARKPTRLRPLGPLTRASACAA